MQNPVLHLLPRDASAENRDLSFKISIIYDSFPGLVRARAMRNRLAKKFRNEIEIESSAWCAALLGHPQLCSQAAVEAAEADMIIVSLRSGEVLSSKVKDWTVAWVLRRRGGQCALAALLEKQEASVDKRAIELLRQNAQDSRMDFFFNWSNRVATVRNEHWRLEPRPVVPRNIIPQDFAWRGWGISE